MVSSEKKSYTERLLTPCTENAAVLEGSGRLQRELGPIELNYHRAIVTGSDNLSLMIRLLSSAEMCVDNISLALQCLSRRHPLLRMSIRERFVSGERKFRFVEMDNPVVHFRVLAEADWYGVAQDDMGNPIDTMNGPLWRCNAINLGKRGKAVSSDNAQRSKLQGPGKSTPFNVNVKDKKAAIKIHQNPLEIDKTTVPGLVLKDLNSASNDDTPYDFEGIFVFTFHHAVLDAGYMLWVFRDFIIFLDSFTNGSRLRSCATQSLPLLPSIENVLLTTLPILRHHFNTNARPKKSHPKYSVVRRRHDADIPQDVLRQYTHRFADEIRDLSTIDPRSRYLVSELTESETRDLIRRCKLQGTTVNGAVWAASVAALVDMVYSPEQTNLRLRVPFELTLDLMRHFVPLQLRSADSNWFSGVSTVGIEMFADCHISKVPVGCMECWEMARAFAADIKHEVQSITIGDLHEIVPEETVSPRSNNQRVKSPFVLCFSNVGILDFLMADEVNKRMKLVELHGSSSVLVDDMPIFFLTVHTLNGKLCVSVSYSENYTSRRTAEEYAARFHSYLQTPSKL